MHGPIFYPRKAIGDDKLITYKWSNHQISTYTSKSTFYVYHVDVTFANILPERRSIQSNVGLLNGVIVSWCTNIQSSIATDSTDTEKKAIFQVSKRACAQRNFINRAQFDPIVNTPPHIYVDNQATIGLIKTNNLSTRSPHLDNLIAFTHDRYMLGYYSVGRISSKLNTADSSTKVCNGPIHHRHTGNFSEVTDFTQP